MADETLSERLASFIAGLQSADLPKQVVQKAQVITLHNLGVALAGYPAVKDFWQVVRRKEGQSGEVASLLIEGRKVPVADAAFANALLIHARAQDDVHGPASTHLGCTVLPAALAVAEALGRTGAEFVVALVAGYEVACALGEVGTQPSTRRGFRATGLFGTLGAAAAAARLMGLSAGQIRNAISIATSMSAGLNQTWLDGSHEWRFQVGQAARNGILAAELAAAGGVGARHAFEGPAGFFNAVAGEPSLAAQCGQELGRKWATLAVTFKPHPVCTFLQTPVEVALRIRHRHNLTADQVMRVRLYMHPFEAAYPGIDGPGPFADVGATLMSAQFSLSVALTHGEVYLRHLSEFTHPGYQRLWPQTSVLPDVGISQGSCRIEVETADRRILVDEYVAGPHTFNYTAEEESALVYGLLPETRMTSESLAAFIDTCLRVDDLPTLRPLFDLSRG